MAEFIDISSGDQPRLNVVWTAQDSVDALAAGVCDCDPVFSSTAAFPKSRAVNTRKHIQRFHEADVIEYLCTRTLNIERYVPFS